MNGEVKPSVHINLMGVDYSVTGYEDAEYLQKVAGLVDQRMRKLNQMQDDIPFMKNAILTALNLADELLQTKRELERYQQETANFSRSVTERSRRLAELCSQC